MQHDGVCLNLVRIIEKVMCQCFRTAMYNDLSDLGIPAILILDSAIG